MRLDANGIVHEMNATSAYPDMSFETVDIPKATRTERDRKYNATPKGKQRKGSYRKSSSEDAYLSRPFVAWDGEGGDETDGTHTYFLLANSLGQSWTSREGLSTVEVFEAFLDQPTDVTHIIYGGNYDVNKILKDLDRETLERIYDTGRANWRGYSIEWRSGKSFRIATRTRKFLLYDVLPFFQRSFVDACDEYLGKDWACRDQIIREKKRRGTFDFTQIEAISEYNRAELATLVRLGNELRQRLHKVDIRVTRWDGPGSIATALYRKYATKSYLGTPPPSVAEAGRHAYAGGRFEIIRKGHSRSKAYQYDIRSAYPSAIRYLPCMAHGEWRHVIKPTRIVPFGVYRIEVTTARPSVTQPQPLWHRNQDGTVYFSEYPHGWYWSPEAALALELSIGDIHEGWEWHTTCECNPFGWVEALYNKRAALKRSGDGAHVGLKLGLNSLYGKLAQQIGWDPGPPLRTPPYHCLEWAGWITSHCRVQVYRASMAAPDDIIAFETDAVFSRTPLDLSLGEGLGDWEETVYGSLTYLKSGLYYGTLLDGTEVEKTRGFNKGSITRQQVIDALAAEDKGDRAVLMAEQTRFITLGQALHQDFTKWGNWNTQPRNIQIALNGKRIDLLDYSKSRKQMGDGWQETEEGFHDTEFSFPYEIAWLGGSHIRNEQGIPLEQVRLDQAQDELDERWYL